MTGTYPAHAYGGVLAGGGDPTTSLAPPGAHLQMGGGEDYVPSPILGDCHHRKDDGEYCGRKPKRGELYCPIHERANEALDFLDDALTEQE